MDELTLWWRAVKAWLAAAPVTRNDEQALAEVLLLAGLSDRSRHALLPRLTEAEEYARSCWRLAILAPRLRTEAGETWWLGGEDESFWSTFEEAAVAKRPESADEIRRQLRSRGGRAVAEDCRSMWPLLADSPERLANKMIRERVLG